MSANVLSVCLSHAGSFEDWSEEWQQSWGAWGCAPHTSALTSMWALNSWPALQALTQQPQSTGSPKPGAQSIGLPSPSQGYCHREGCWTEKPRITMMKWPPALRRGTHEEKNSDMETTQIPVHCRCHKTSNIVLYSCSPMGKHGTHRRDKWRASEHWRTVLGSQQPWSQGPAHLC